MDESMDQGADQSLGYLLFLKGYSEIIKSYPGLYPVKYSDVSPPNRSAARFMRGLGTVNYDSVQTEYLGSRDPAAFTEDLSKVLSDDFIGIETLAKQFRLDEHAELLRDNRREQAAAVMKWLRMERPGPDSS
jgi:hypothetical protein